jgi:hypothetical protein
VTIGEMMSLLDPGYVVFALLSIFLFFALSFSTTFGKDLYADLDIGCRSWVRRLCVAFFFIFLLRETCFFSQQLERIREHTVKNVYTKL